MAEAVLVRLNVLNSGSHERLKAAVHATAFGLAIVMGAYNTAAWLRRRQPHLAVNAMFYAALAAWEQRHVAHHLATLRSRRDGELARTVVAKPRKIAA